MQVFNRLNHRDYSSWLFFGLVLSYLRLYAPFGINETDGGFLTGLAWRCIQGEQLYTDIIYVRPPLSVWLRSLELWLLPDSFEIIAERCGFYLKVAAYSFLGASVLLKGSAKWWMASLGFIVSVHCYPAAAWHTVDGILFGVLAFWLLFKRRWVVAAAFCVLLAMLCKQSFYPILPVFLVMVAWLYGGRVFWRGMLSWGIFAGLFGVYLWWQESLFGFLEWTRGASSLTAAIEHGVLDYFKIDWRLWGCCLLLIPLFIKQRVIVKKRWWWRLFVLAIIASYGFNIYRHQFHTVPVDQSRLLFLLAAAFLVFKIGQRKGRGEESWIKALALLSVSWMAAVSWGYAFPILFATPWLYLLHRFAAEKLDRQPSKRNEIWRLALLFSLLLVFRYGYEYIYRDGQRSQMQYSLETLFPKLKYIYSDAATFEKYRELKELTRQYEGCFSVLPSFPLANYLTETRSPLPLDWVIAPEINSRSELVLEEIENSGCHYFIEKSYKQDIQDRKKFELTKMMMQRLDKLDEKKHFYVYY